LPKVINKACPDAGITLRGALKSPLFKDFPMNTQDSNQGPGGIFAGVARMVELVFAAANLVLLLFATTMCIVMLVQIISRYLFNAPLTWPEETARYLFIWVVFLGAAVAFKARAHLGMDFATSKLSLGIRHIVARVVEVLIFGFLLLILYITPEIVSVTKFQKSSVLHIQMSWVYLSFPTASVLMMLDLLVRWFCPRKSFGEEE
jgi:TRAP-type C4-dicarboxylate transport system permease small subunit